MVVASTYAKDLQVYLDKQDNQSEKEKGKRVVMDLLTSYLPTGHTTDIFSQVWHTLVFTHW